MKLHEYQVKQLVSSYGLSVPNGYACNTPHEAEESASKIDTDMWVVKCQIHSGGRSKAGGVKIVKSKKDIRLFAERWLGNRLVTYQTGIIGQPVNKILVEAAATDIIKEIYLSAFVDRSICRVVFMTSVKGGVNIENIAKDYPYLIHKVILDPFTGPQPYQGRELAYKIGLNGNQVFHFSKIFMDIANLFLERDLSLIEINPLVMNSAGKFICLDGKVIVDGNALFRQPDLRKMRDQSQEEELEFYAKNCGFNYIQLDGNIGCMVNGAGLGMGTMDIIRLYGGELANILDVGGNINKGNITEALKIILSDKKVKAVLINIFGGIVQCDLIAEGIIYTLYEINNNIPYIVVRLEGNNAKLGIKILLDSGLNIVTATSLSDAVKQVIFAANNNFIF